MSDLWQFIIPGIFTVIITILEVRSSGDRKRAQREQALAASRAARRAEESLLSMKFMSASCKLSVVTAKAVTNQHVNGDVEEAMEEAKKAQEDYEQFIRRQAAERAVKI